VQQPILTKHRRAARQFRDAAALGAQQQFFDADEVRVLNPAQVTAMLF
jgi:hypothetical protein